MTYIPEIYQGAAPTSQATQKDSDSQTLGQDDFLTLLVAQMQYQDPLDPTDSSEWTSQLAQYSQLEQSMNLNTTMELLVDGQKSSERLAALSLIGKEAVVEGSTFSLDGEATEIGYRVDGSASSIQLHIQNSNGTRVSTLNPTDNTTGNHFLTWEGLDANGDPLPAGEYSIVIEAQSDGVGTVGVSPLVRADITGVDLDENGTVLLTNVGDFALSSIHGVYDRNQGKIEPKDGSSSLDVQDTIEQISAATDGAGII